MNTVFLAMLAGVLLIGLLGALSSRAAKRRARQVRIALDRERLAIGQHNTQDAEDPAEVFAAAGVGQTDLSQNMAHSKARGN